MVEQGPERKGATDTAWRCRKSVRGVSDLLQGRPRVLVQSDDRPMLTLAQPAGGLAHRPVIGKAASRISTVANPDLSQVPERSHTTLKSG